MSILGIDVGITGCKAVAFTIEGKVISQSYREYTLLQPQLGWAELYPNDIWNSTKEVIHEVAAKTKKDPIKTIGVSTQGEAVVPIDKKGNCLYNFTVSFDKRTTPQSQWWDEVLGKERIFQITGMPLHPMYSINKIMWFRENVPESYRKTHRFLCVEDFILYKLGLPPVIDYSLASRTMAFNVQQKRWSRKILAFAKIDEECLSPIVPSGQIVGKIPKSIAEDIGLRNDVNVVTGGDDQACGALGAGVIRPGIVMNAIGTAEVLCLALNKPILNNEMLCNNYACYNHVVENMYVTIAFNLTGGLLLRWFRNNLCQQEIIEARKTNRDVYETIINNASKDVSDLYFLPHFVGSGTPSLNPYSRGAVIGLTLNTTKNQLTKAILDSLSYETKVNIDLLSDMGAEIDVVRAIGGGAKSRKWLQLKSDIYGKEVDSLEVSEAVSLGAAILAGTAIGEYSSINEAVKNLVKVRKRYLPDFQQHRKYEKHYEVFKEIYPALKKLNMKISTLAGHNVE